MHSSKMILLSSREMYLECSNSLSMTILENSSVETLNASRRCLDALTNAPVLDQLDPIKLYVIEADASDFAISYTLREMGNDKKSYHIIFVGCKLRGAELNYLTYEKELLAIKKALVK